MSEYLFVYGLLRKDAYHEVGRFLSENSTFISRAYFQGKLYQVNYYPGMIPSSEPRDQVTGDLLQLKSAEVLEVLDEFEGVGTRYVQPQEYRREKNQVRTSDGNAFKCWMYLYNHPVDKLEQIPSGDFLHPDG